MLAKPPCAQQAIVVRFSAAGGGQHADLRKVVFVFEATCYTVPRRSIMSLFDEFFAQFGVEA